MYLPKAVSIAAKPFEIGSKPFTRHNVSGHLFRVKPIDNLKMNRCGFLQCICHPQLSPFVVTELCSDQSQLTDSREVL